MTQKGSIFNETSYNSDSCSDYSPINKKKNEQNEEVIQLSNHSNDDQSDEFDIENLK